MKRAVSIKFHNLGILFLFLLISYGITSYSSTLTYSTVCGNLDSYCYRYMGMLVAKGGVPYRDAFDNKGPFIYFLNCIGYIISKNYGVFFVEYFFMLSYLSVQYTIARRFVDIKQSIIYTIAALGPIGAFFVGNMTEEYALLFISIGQLVFIDYFLFNKTAFYRIFVCGISCGVVLMLRPNMVALWVVFCLYAIFYNYRQEKRFPLKIATLFLLGILIAVVPFLVWLGVNNGIKEFWKDYIVTNIGYSTDCNSKENIFKSFISYFFPSLSEIYLILLFFLIKKRINLGFNISYAIYMIVNILVISLPGKGFEHYGMITVPTLIYPICACSGHLKRTLKAKSFLYDITALLSSCILIGFIINNYFVTIPVLISGNQKEPRDARVVSVIDQNTEIGDRILVFGFKDYYYVEADRMASSKFHFFTSTNEHYPGGLSAVTEDINTNLPKLVIVDDGFDCNYLNFNFDNYRLMDADLGIWIRD